MPAPTPLACIVLAAGKGTRMQSDLPKVLHPIAGVPMLGHVLRAVEPLGPDQIVVVVSPDASRVSDYVKPHLAVVQEQQKGTGHAVMAAREALAGFEGDVAVLFGDHPLFTSATIQRLIKARTEGGADHAVAMLAMRPADLRAYGRLIMGPQGLERIVEARDATPEELAVDLVWGGMLVADGRVLFQLLDRLDNANAQGEYYLPYIVQKAREIGRTCGVAEVGEMEASGVNSRAELAAAERIAQDRLRNQAMAHGATLIDPSTTYFSLDTRLGRDILVEPNVVFGPGVSLGDDVTIKAFSHIEGAMIAEGAVIGPFARLRPGTIVGKASHIGNFVELKNTSLGDGAKANHLTYLGDADIGHGSNVGAGTITCNYDGYFKHRTTIGANSFIGSNSSLVAPVTLGEGSMTGAGSTITQDVPADALAVSRARQVTMPGKAAAFRSAKRRAKESLS